MQLLGNKKHTCQNIIGFFVLFFFGWGGVQNLPQQGIDGIGIQD